jgi:holo-[acyl-carrier protein] synthase
MQGGETRVPSSVYDPGMQIIGIGLDATEIPRIAATMDRFGDRFLSRIFTREETAYCQARRRAVQHFAARFAVKEAAMKALGTGRSRGVRWRDVEVVRRAGPPQLELHGLAAQRFEQMGGRQSVVTITHTDALALAHVILLGERAL